MSGVAKKLMGTTAAGGGFTAIEEVFSSYLYTGNSSTQTITNGIDLAGEGGLVWVKGRDQARENALADTERGTGVWMSSNLTNGNLSNAQMINQFNSDGFRVGTESDVNFSGEAYASWTFRKAPRFFDVVTYTGDGVAGRQIPHDLGTTVGTLIIRRTDSSQNWFVWHRAYANNQWLVLSETYDLATTGTTGELNNTTPTDSVFTVGSGAITNASGGTYVAYLFAHDPLGPSGDGSDGLIACGSVSGFGTVVNLGWEPQWILMKRTNGTSDWILADTMRGIPTGSQDALLFANTSGAETSANDWIDLTSTGFVNNVGSGDFIYIAIRRGPMRAPESGTEVFAPAQYDGTKFPTGFPVDFAIAGNAAGTDKWYFQSRLQGKVLLSSASTAAEVGTGSGKFDLMDGYGTFFTTAYYSTAFRRAPEFFDVVAYTGDGVAGRTVPHNLGVAPELMIVKGRTNTENWVVYHSASGATQYLRLNTNNAATTSSVFWNNTAPTDTEFTVGAGNTNNASGINYIAYLFASVAGVSKVGSYTGNGTSQTINCGFTAGARFVLIKRISSTGGNWLVWDTARGIVVGNEPYLGLNLTTAETSVDYIDPDPAGFKVINVNTNNSGDTYIFYAIA